MQVNFNSNVNQVRPNFQANFVNNRNFRTCLERVELGKYGELNSYNLKQALKILENDGTKDVLKLKSNKFLNLFGCGNVILRNGKTVFKCDSDNGTKIEQFIRGIKDYANIVEFNNQFIPNTAQLKDNPNQLFVSSWQLAYDNATNFDEKKLAAERFCTLADNIEFLKKDSFFQDLSKAFKEKYNIK